MYLGSLFHGLRDVVRSGASAEVNRDRMLTGRDIDNWRWHWKECFVFCKIGDSEGCGHDDEPERLFSIDVQINR